MASKTASTLVTCVSFLVVQARADEQPPQGTGAGAPTVSNDVAEVNPLQEIIVTATRRAESAEKVPISLMAIGQGELSQAGIRDMADLAQATPGLQFGTPTGFISQITTISIRGMNTNSGPSTVGIYLDDTPLQTRLSTLAVVGNPYPDIFDLSRVEVARGPQGTLFGAGSEAGTVRFITNQPSVTQFSGFSHAELSTTQDGAPSYEIGAAAGGPIIQDVAGFRISAWDRRDGGFIDLLNPVTGTVAESNANRDDKQALRAAFLFVLPGVRITPAMHYQSVNSYDSGRFWGLFSNASNDSFRDGPLRPDLASESFWLPSLKIEADLPFADLISNTSYMERRAHATTDLSAYLGALGFGYGSPLGSEIATSPTDVAPTLNTQHFHSATEEVRLVSRQKDAPVSWVAGVFYDHRVQDDAQVTSYTNLDPTGAPIYDVDQEFVDDQIAAYAQADVHVTHQLTATVGARVAHVRVDMRALTGPGVFDIGVPPVSTVSSRNTPTTPRFALSYQLDNNNLVYASASKGFRVGGGNQLLPDYCNSPAVPGSYDPDEVWSYEIGAKDTVLDGRLRLDASAFHVKWSDIQQKLALQCGFTYTVNAGSAVSNGFDLAVHAAAMQHLRVDLSVGYVDAHFTTNVYDPTGAPVVLSGDEIGSLPQVNSPWNANTAAIYDWSIGDADKLSLRGEYQFQSRNRGPFITGIAGSSNYFPLLTPDPPTHLVSSRVTYTHENLDVALFCDNLFDSTPLLSKYQYAASSSLFTYTTFRPRTVGVSASFSF